MGGPLGAKLLMSLLMLLPFAVYAVRKKLWKWNELDPESKPLAIAFAAVLLVAIVFAIASGDTPRNQTSAPTQSISASASLDTSATVSAAEDAEKAKAEQEAKAKAEAEEKAKAEAEAEAKAKAEAETKKKEEAAAKKEAEKQKKLADLEAYFPQETAYKVAQVALTNTQANDVFQADGNTLDPARFHSYSDTSGFHLLPCEDGTWTYKDEDSWHVDDIEFVVAGWDSHLGGSFDVNYDGTNYNISNLDIRIFNPGHEDMATDLSDVEDSPTLSATLTVTPELLN